MAHTYYEQSDYRPTTMTVGDLIERLQSFKPSEPVIFKSPQYGCFGSGTSYSIDKVDLINLDRREHHTPGGSSFDEETGEPSTYEAYTQVFEAWQGVVIG